MHPTNRSHRRWTNKKKAHKDVARCSVPKCPVCHPEKAFNIPNLDKRRSNLYMQEAYKGLQ